MMTQYLLQLKLETLFCRFFTIDSIKNLLDNYGQRLKYNYKIELLNLFQLLLTKAQFIDLNTKLKTLHPDKLTKLLDVAFNKLITFLDIDDAGLISYMKEYHTIFILQVTTAQDIIHIIQTHIQSLSDFMDLVNSGCRVERALDHINYEEINLY